MHTARVPLWFTHVWTNNLPKKWLLPEPRPPYAPLYLAARNSGAYAIGTGILRVENFLLLAFRALWVDENIFNPAYWSWQRIVRAFSRSLNLPVKSVCNSIYSLQIRFLCLGYQRLDNLVELRCFIF